MTMKYMLSHGSDKTYGKVQWDAKSIWPPLLLPLVTALFTANHNQPFCQPKPR